MSDHALPRPWVSAAVRSRRRRIAIGLAARYSVLVLTIIITVFPLVWLFLTSLRSSADLFAVPVHIIPESVTASQYIDIFRCMSLADYAWNTIIVSLTTVIFVTVLALPCAYAWRGSDCPARR